MTWKLRIEWQQTTSLLLRLHHSRHEQVQNLTGKTKQTSLILYSNKLCKWLICAVLTFWKMTFSSLGSALLVDCTCKSTTTQRWITNRNTYCTHRGWPLHKINFIQTCNIKHALTSQLHMHHVCIFAFYSKNDAINQNDIYQIYPHSIYAIYTTKYNKERTTV